MTRNIDRERHDRFRLWITAVTIALAVALMLSGTVPTTAAPTDWNRIASKNHPIDAPLRAKT